MAAAEPPLSTSIRSMSSGLRSAMRLTGLSWFRGLPPAWAAVTASAPFGIASLLTTMPSITKRLFDARR